MRKMRFSWVISLFGLHMYIFCGASAARDNAIGLPLSTATVSIRLLAEAVPNGLNKYQLESIGCRQIKNRFGSNWQEGAFGNCQLHNYVMTNNQSADMDMTVTVNKEPFSRHAGVPSDAAITWNINRLLNSGDGMCTTSVALGTEREIAPPPTRWSGVTEFTYILLSNDTKWLCWKVLRQLASTNDIYIGDCWLYGYADPDHPGSTPAKYVLQVEVEDIEERALHYPDFQLRFLRELGKLYGGCQFNGYTPVYRPIKSVTVQYLFKWDTSYFPYEETAICRSLEKYIGPLWQNRKISMCRLERIESKVDWEYSVVTTMFVDGHFLEADTGTPSNIVLAWKLNVLINSGSGVCHTTVQFLGRTMEPPYVLVAEDSTTLCPEIMSQPQFVGGRVQIHGCKKSEKLWKVRGGKSLALYTLDMRSTIHSNYYSESVDYQLPFLKELSERSGSCKFNGFWSLAWLREEGDFMFKP